MPSDYEDYMWIDPGTGDCTSGNNPGDAVDGDRGLPESFDCKNSWKDTNYAPLPGDPEFDPAVATNPAEYGGVKGARVSQAWEVTTGRPDTVVAVMDSGIKWDGRNSVTGKLSESEIDELNGLRKKFYLNPGELPVPGPAGCANPGWGGHDRNCDGIFNVVDYEAADGCQTNCVTDVNKNTPTEANGCEDDPDDAKFCRDNPETLIDPQDLILTYSDTVDDDNNGYVDDISGWDFFENDNDANDDVDYGHGTGESIDSGHEAEAQRTYYDTGVSEKYGLCPNCMLMEMRVGDSFIADVNHWAEATVYATDNGASVVQEALGTLNNTSFGQAAADYAYENGVVIVASAADESAAHHNYPSNYNHTMVVNSVNRFNEEEGIPVQQPRSYLYLNGCTNFGGHIYVAVPSSSCSSDATGHAAGQAGLLYSAVRNAIDRGSVTADGPLTNYIRDDGTEAPYPLSAEEAMQMFRLGAEDIDFSPPNSTTGYSTTNAVPSRRFQSVNGWDMFFGYGRINVNKMLRDRGFVPKSVADPPEIVIPPEADIASPAWFAPLPPTGTVDIEGRVAANRVTSEGGTFDYVVEWAAGAQPTLANDDLPETEWHQAASEEGRSEALEGKLATLDMAEVAAEVAAIGPAVFDPATDPTSRDLPEKNAFRVRVTVTDSNGAVGVFQKQFFVNEDPDLLPAFPKHMGSDGAGSPAFADIDADGTDELVLSTANGKVHAMDQDGEDIAGWPVSTDPIDLPTSGANAFTQAGDGIDGPVNASILLGSPAIGDIVPGDDGEVEIAAADLEGKLYVWNANGSRVPGFPVEVNRNFSEEPGCEEVGVDSPGTLPPCDDFVGNGTTGAFNGTLDTRDEFNAVDHGFNHNPVIADIDPDAPGLEIVLGAGDNHVYAWQADGSPVEGWPLLMRDPAKVASVNPQTHKFTYAANADPYPGSKVIVSPSVGDVDDDGDLDVVVAVNEEYEEEPNASRIREQLGDILGQINDVGNSRLYVIDARGTGAGPSTTDNHPNEQAFLPGWPARIAILAARILPYVGEGADGAPTLADVDGNGDLEIGVATVIGPGYLFDHNGQSHFGQDPQGRDITFATSEDEFKGDAQDGPAFVAVGGGSFGELLPGQTAWTAPTGGLARLLDIVLNSQQLRAEDHVSAWDGQLGTFMPGFPSVVNDLQFFTTPSVADVTGDGIPEVLEGTAVYDVRAVNALGRTAGRWPKFTGGWNLASVGTGDLNGNHILDVAMISREGWLFVWETRGDACQGTEWAKYQHDLANTGNYNAPRSNPASCFPPPGAEDVPHSLELSPDTSSDPVGTTKSYTATVTDENGQPLEGINVTWSERGAGSITSSEATTDANGQAQAEVTSTDRGDQTVTASTAACTTTGDCSDTSVQHWGTAGCDVYGTEDDDVLTGTGASETICGFGGNDTILGKGGDDELRGHQGDDSIRGGSGIDHVIAGRGGDDVVGGPGADRLGGSSGHDALRGQLGEDDVVGGRGNDVMAGGDDDDHMTGRPDDDEITGDKGDDVVSGGDGHDTLYGNPGNDTVGGHRGDDFLRGANGNDRLDGGQGADDCNASPGANDSERRCET